MRMDLGSSTRVGERTYVPGGLVLLDAPAVEDDLPAQLLDGHIRVPVDVEHHPLEQPALHGVRVHVVELLVEPLRLRAWWGWVCGWVYVLTVWPPARVDLPVDSRPLPTLCRM